MRVKLPLSVLVAVLAASSACKKKSSSDAPPPPPPCTLAALGASCNAGTECCSGNCANHICVEPAGQCRQLTATCAAPSNCCSGACNGTNCVDPAGGCFAVGHSCSIASECCLGACENATCIDPAQAKGNGESCTADAQCLSGYCSLTSPRTCQPPPSGGGCLDEGASCTSATASTCCSAVCDATGHCGRVTQCTLRGNNCDRDEDCCSLNCTGGTCASEVCRKDNAACADPSQCCSGICTGNLCQPIPPGPTGATCKTLGEACSLPSDCCSTNCQGSSGTGGGTCKPAAFCNATGDICDTGLDCCSGMCAAPAAAGQPGRCEDAPGGCGQDGYPCASDSNCCTKKCVDSGYGAKTCTVSGGCRMNGDYCDSDAACCNVNFSPTPTSQYVHCDPNEHLCDNGGSCNPPGDICGYKASQDCCYGKKSVCRPDSAGIMRCFGGPPAHCPVSSTCDTVCPQGWDGNDPQCCIPQGDICQFRDQCCGFAPCVPDASGVLRCSAPPSTCKSRGTTCNGASDTSCCSPLTCQNVTEVGWICTDTTPPPQGCTLQNGAACTVGAAAPSCCVTGYTCTTPSGSSTGTCALCAPTGNSCSSSADCCSPDTCDATTHVCVAPCQGEFATCTATSDCCPEFSCDIPSGSTSGQCTTGTGPACSQTGQSCVVTADCCNAATGDVCSPSFVCISTACHELNQVCTAAAVGGQPQQGECCNTLLCYQQNLTTGVREPCAAGSTCFCDAPSCGHSGDTCSTLVDCCAGDPTYCAQNGTGVQCTSSDPSQCTCVPNG